MRRRPRPPAGHGRHHVGALAGRHAVTASALAVALVAGAVVASCAPSSAPGVVAPAHDVSGARHAAAASVTAVPTEPAPTTTTTDPGTLPQTTVEPTADAPAFEARVHALWQAVVDANPAEAMPFFFPLSAYIQVKAIADPEHDWQERLVADFDADVLADHAALGPDAPAAQFTSVTVPAAAVWVRPGVEYNKGSYWRVYGTVVRYVVDGRPGEFPIASMISWRGEWYVVHLASIR